MPSHRPWFEGASDATQGADVSSPPQTAGIVALYDPDPERAERCHAALVEPPSLLHVIRENSFEGLARVCESALVAAVAVPFMKGPSGIISELLDFLHVFARRLPVLIYADTTHLPIGVYCQPLAAGARQVLNESLDGFLGELRTTVERLVRDQLAHLHEQEQLEQLFTRCGLVGRSPGMRDVFRRALKASHFNDLPVLILGETGTGKQRLAEAIHQIDATRRDKPFITINCGAITKSLAESELFGHSRGAFSGAGAERKGLFRAANGGTLMLDEIGELDPDLQTKLLRVLQERRLLPVGEDYEHHIDVRLIAATNRPLEEMVAQGKFREDLYQRINVLRIHMPPLRERPEDIAMQALHFLALHQGEKSPRTTSLSPQVREALQALPWEGNSRQLENLIREILVHRETDSSALELADLPRWVFEKLALALPVPSAPPVAVPPLADSLIEEAWGNGLTLHQAVEDFERRLIQRVLQATGGNRTHAAHRLGLTPRTIFNKINKYQLD